MRVECRGRPTAALLGLLLLACAGQAGLPAPSPRAIDPSDDWTGHGRDTDEQRYSPLAQINVETIGRLGLAWSLDLPGEIALEGTPLEVSGTLYFSGGLGAVYAVDAVSGRQLWHYQPDMEGTNAREARLAFGVNRGVAYWQRKVYVALKDGRMVALDAKTGRPVWIRRFLIEGDKASSTGAPRVFNGKVIIGNSGAEVGARGYVTTLDAANGALLWRFFLVPGDPAKGPDHAASDSIMPTAAKSWSGDWWKYGGGGGTAWNGITYDAELNQVYIGTGNAAPWNPRFRSNGEQDNLFLTSVVAVDADSGRYKWHYQYNPLESWDYKATADIILADLQIDGTSRKVLMQAPSNGFFYVIDRHSGKLISAEKLGKATWAERIDIATGRPVERPDIRYENGPTTIYPGALGAHNWQASSFNPGTGLIYIPYMQVGTTYTPSPLFESLAKIPREKFAIRLGVMGKAHIDPTDPLDGRGSLLAWDPVRQKLRWRVDHPSFWNAGTMTTAGNLVFQGTNNGQFYGYDASTGKRIWAFDTKLGIVAPPISYAVAGRQYVSLLVGYGTPGVPGMDKGWKYGAQPRRLLTFRLDGKARLPVTASPDLSVHALDDPAMQLDAQRVARGGVVYLTCSLCHGSPSAAGTAPDLRESAVAFDRPSFTDLLRSGVLLSRGMPKYDDLSDEEIEDLYQFIRSKAREARSGKDGAAGQASM